MIVCVVCIRSFFWKRVLRIFWYVALHGREKKTWGYTTENTNFYDGVTVDCIKSILNEHLEAPHLLPLQLQVM